METAFSIAFIFAICCFLIYLDTKRIKNIKTKEGKSKIKSIILFPSGIITVLNEDGRIIDELSNINYVKILLEKLSEDYDIEKSEVFLPNFSKLTKVWKVKNVRSFLNLT